MALRMQRAGTTLCRSRKGAWIEMLIVPFCKACNTGRSRKGAWIEIRQRQKNLFRKVVAPVRERGLKLLQGILKLKLPASLP